MHGCIETPNILILHTLRFNLGLNQDFQSRLQVLLLVPSNPMVLSTDWSQSREHVKVGMCLEKIAIE